MKLLKLAQLLVVLPTAVVLLFVFFAIGGHAAFEELLSFGVILFLAVTLIIEAVIMFMRRNYEVV